MSTARQRPATATIWGWPLALGAVTAGGLVSALLSDGGLGDTLACVCLACPLAAGLWFGWLRAIAVRKH